jgi:hypothetical protein
MKTSRRKRTTEITIDSDEVIVTHHRPSILWWCETCGRQSLMMPLDEAAQMAGVDLSLMSGWVKSGSVHQTETGGNTRMICWASLARQL